MAHPVGPQGIIRPPCPLGISRPSRSTALARTVEMDSRRRWDNCHKGWAHLVGLGDQPIPWPGQGSTKPGLGPLWLCLWYWLLPWAWSVAHVVSLFLGPGLSGVGPFLPLCLYVVKSKVDMLSISPLCPLFLCVFLYTLLACKYLTTLVELVSLKPYLYVGY